jgi:multiple sugar transport system ATP-binding protein
MDEPLSNLDAKLRSQMRTELQRLQEDLDVTTIYVTHDQTEAMTMADKIAILNDGELQQVGTPLECYHEPSNTFVAGFIGEPSMNFFDVTLDNGQLVHEHFEYDLSEETADSMSGYSDLILGIRPEDVELRAEAEGPHCYETVVDVVEPMGDENNVYLTFEETGDDETFVANISGMQHVESGQPVVAHIPEEAIHVFDRASGESLRNRKLESVEEITLQP